jgi:flagellar basal-body rod protein FlgF
MDSTMLVSLSHQVAVYQAMDSIANNLANVSTPAYQRETPTFEEFVSQVQPTEGESGTQNVSYAAETGTVRDLSEGPIESTGGRFDFAIKGKGYFAIQTADGERYTRNGHFTLDQNGVLTTQNGDQVETDSGPLSLTPQDLDVTVSGDGTVSATISGTQAELGKLKVVSFDNERAMQKQGSSLYSTDQTPNGAPPNVKIEQGMLEGSNVQPVVEISHMIELMRAYQATANLSQSQETMKTQALDKLAQVQS